MMKKSSSSSSRQTSSQERCSNSGEQQLPSSSSSSSANVNNAAVVAAPGDAAVNAAEDDYGDFEGADVEDEAPEAVQAHSTVGSPWATFPDLLRVPTSSGGSAANAVLEDDPPESLNFTTQRSRNGIALDSAFNIDSLHHHHHHHHTNRVLEQTGARPKIRPLAPPDISQIASPSSSSASSSSSAACSSSGAGGTNCTSSTATAGTVSSSAATISPDAAVPFKPLPFKVTSFPSKLSLTAGNLQSANRTIGNGGAGVGGNLSSVSVTSSLINSGARLSTIGHRAEESSSVDLGSLVNAVTRLQCSVDTLTREMNTRLTALEVRLNNLASGCSNAATAGTGNTSGATTTLVDTSNVQANIIRAFRDELQRLNAEQRQSIQEERSTLLLTLSEAMRRSAVPKSNDTGMNGPR